MKLIELSEVEILIMKSIWKLGDGITVYEIIDYLDQVYDRKYTRSTVKTYITKLKKKGFVDTQVKGNYSYITAKITEEMYREEQMELMKDFWHDGSMKELVQTLTHTISKEEKEELKDLINDFVISMILLNGLVGSISYMCFRKIRQRLEKKGLISMCITVLRGAVLSFLMPIVIVLIYFIYYVYEEDYTMFALSPLVGWVFFVVGIIWTIGF